MSDDDGDEHDSKSAARILLARLSIARLPPHHAGLSQQSDEGSISRHERQQWDKCCNDRPYPQVVQLKIYNRYIL